MANKTKLICPVKLFVAIESRTHDLLRNIAFREKKSLADITREALAQYLEKCDQSRPRR